MRKMFTEAASDAAVDASAQQAAIALNRLRKGDSAMVLGVDAGQGDDAVALRRRLLELGFVPGETIRIVAESFPSRDPIAVRLGNTTFALRRHEAALIQVVPAARKAA